MTTTLPAAIQGNQNAYNARNAGKVAENYAEDATFQDPFLPQPIQGKGAIKQYHEGLFSAFPDFTVSTRWSVVSGETTLLINTAAATNKGPIRTPDGKTIPPTNRKFQGGEYAVVFQLNKAGKIQSLRVYGDSLAIFKQLGLNP